MPNPTSSKKKKLLIFLLSLSQNFGIFKQFLANYRLDEGEVLLKEMQNLRDELSQYEDEVQRLIETAGEIVPLRARRERLRQPIEAVAICKYQSSEVKKYAYILLF